MDLLESEWMTEGGKGGGRKVDPEIEPDGWAMIKMSVSPSLAHSLLLSLFLSFLCSVSGYHMALVTNHKQKH